MTLISGILLLYCFLYGCCLQSFNTKIFVLFLLQLIFWLLILALVLFAVFYAEGLINFQDGTWLNSRTSFLYRFNHVLRSDAALLVILAWCGVLSILAWMFQWGLSRQHLPEEDFLDNIFSPAELEEGLLRLRAAPPKIKMSMAAFHEETEWVERSDGEETTINCETTRFYAWKSSRFHKYRCSQCS